MAVEVDDLREVDDGRIVQFALLAAGDKLYVVDLQLVLLEVAVVVLVVSLQSGILKLQLLHPQLQLLHLTHPTLNTRKCTYSYAILDCNYYSRSWAWVSFYANSLRSN
jgi:hypothetical protein